MAAYHVVRKRSMNTLEMEFIAGAARAMFVTAWADRQEDTCMVCSYQNGPDDRNAHAEWAEAVGVNPHKFDHARFELKVPDIEFALEEEEGRSCV